MRDLTERRRAYSWDIAAAANLTTSALVDALEAIPREQFLRPGPWLVVDDPRRPPRWTPDDNPDAIYADVSVAIDPERHVFNGAPSVLTNLIDQLALQPGSRVLHVGAGTGYYSALIGHVIGPDGHVEAIEIDDALAADARANLAATPWIDVRCGDGTAVTGPFDAILVNAGVTHPQESWLDAMAPNGRLVMPLTVTMPALGPALGKGAVVVVERTPGDRFTADALSFVTINSAIGLRDDALGERLGQALRRTSFPNLTRLRRDAHPSTEACWFHAERFCLSMEPS